jgi:hypothetical protein
MSNTRRPRNSRRRSGSRRGGRARLEQLGHDELYEHLAVMQAADEAEAHGDAEGVAEIMASMPVGPDGKPFWRPGRVRRIAQLVELRDVLPRWAISRWILSQALQTLDAGARDLSGLAMQTAIDVRGGEAELPGVDDLDARAKVMDHDWAYRQQFLYDLGGLRHFLGATASADLVAGADRVHDWADAEMGGYRLLAVSSLTLRWEDLATGQLLDVMNIGSAALVDVGECVIGRVVPIEEGAMFESSPLPVPEEVARQVAQEPDCWVEVLGSAVRDRTARKDAATVRILLTGAHDYGLLTDVPDAIWRTVTAPTFGRIVRLSENPSAVVVDAVHLVEVATTRVTLDQERLERAWPCVAAALVAPEVVPVLRGRVELLSAESLLVVAEHLAEPAATVCRGLAELCRKAS